MGGGKKKRKKEIVPVYVPDPNVDLSMFPIKHSDSEEEDVAKIYDGKLLTRTGDSSVFIFESEEMATQFKEVLQDVVGYTTKKIDTKQVEVIRGTE